MTNYLWFAVRLRLLSKRTSNIVHNIQNSSFDDKDDLEMLERETNTCLAMLQQLGDYAQKHHPGMGGEEHQISQKILQDLDKAKKTIESIKMPWWQKLLGMLAKLLPAVRELLSTIEHFIPNIYTRVLLRGIDAVKLLAPGK
jgi:hypothetical protein